MSKGTKAGSLAPGPCPSLLSISHLVNAKLSVCSAYDPGPVFTCHRGPRRWVLAPPPRHPVLSSSLCSVSWDAGLCGLHPQAPLPSGFRLAVVNQRHAYSLGRKERERRSTSFLDFLPVGGRRLAPSLLSHSSCQEALSKAWATHGCPCLFLPAPLQGWGGTSCGLMAAAGCCIVPHCPLLTVLAPR